MNWRGLLESLTITLAAIASSLLLFGLFLWAYNLWANNKTVSPLDLYGAIYQGGFGHRTQIMKALTKAAPLILTALCTALPARLGLVIIGGEGALVAGGLAAAVVVLSLGGLPTPLPFAGMALAGMVAGGAVIALAGALRHWRGVNATISSLLFAYVVIGVFTFLVEGPLKDPASTNTPSTHPIPASAVLGKMPGLDVHWGLAFGVVACVLAWLLLDHTTFGFATRMAGGNVRAAQVAGLPVGRLVLITCFLAGAAAGLAGAVEIAAVQKQANANLIVGYGYTGILVSFIARHHPLGILPVALLFGGLKASSDVLQYRLGLPDASVDVLAGTTFVVILLFETLYGRFNFFQPRELREGEPAVVKAAA